MRCPDSENDHDDDLTNQGEGERNETVWTLRTEPPWEGRAWDEAGVAALGRCLPWLHVSF